MGCPNKSVPDVPLWDLTTNLVRIALQSSVSNYDGAGRLAEHFSEAGLPYPNRFCEEPVGGPVRIHHFTVHSLNSGTNSGQTFLVAAHVSNTTASLHLLPHT